MNAIRRLTAERLVMPDFMFLTRGFWNSSPVDELNHRYIFVKIVFEAWINDRGTPYELCGKVKRHLGIGANSGGLTEGVECWDSEKKATWQLATEAATAPADSRGKRLWEEYVYSYMMRHCLWKNKAGKTVSTESPWVVVGRVWIKSFQLVFYDDTPVDIKAINRKLAKLSLT